MNELQTMYDILSLLGMIYLCGTVWYFIVAMDKYYAKYSVAPPLRTMARRIVEGLVWPVCLVVGCVLFVYRGLCKC